MLADSRVTPAATARAPRSFLSSIETHSNAMHSSNDPTGPEELEPSGSGDPDHDSLRRAPSAKWVEGQRKDASAAGAGLQFGMTICAFALLGLWLDGKFDTGPWLLVVGVLLAFFGGTVSLLKKFS